MTPSDWASVTTAIVLLWAGLFGSAMVGQEHQERRIEAAAAR